MFRRHQILLPFIVAVELLVREGKMTPKESQLLSMDLGGLEAQLDSMTRKNNKRQEGDEIPVWISRKVRPIYRHYFACLCCRYLLIVFNFNCYCRLGVNCSSYRLRCRPFTNCPRRFQCTVLNGRSTLM